MKKALEHMDISTLLPEEDLENLAELLNYPLRQHKQLLEKHTDQEITIETFTGNNLKQLVDELGFEKAVQQIALILKEKIDEGHQKIEEELEKCGSANQH